MFWRIVDMVFYNKKLLCKNIFKTPKNTLLGLQVKYMNVK